MRIIGTIEARMGSERLPGKTLMELYGSKSLLEIVVSRFRRCKNIDDVFVATSAEKSDDLIEQFCSKNNIKYFRGSENDLLDRVTKTAVLAKADAIVQMGADSAYLDFELIDQLINIYKSGGFDYVCNDLEWTYPIGIYGHVIRVSSLVELNKKRDLTERERDDVARFIWEHPDIYKIKNILAPEGAVIPELRLTIDYPEDMELAREIYRYFDRLDFTTSEIMKLYKLEPHRFDKIKGLKQRSTPFMK